MHKSRKIVVVGLGANAQLVIDTARVLNMQVCGYTDLCQRPELQELLSVKYLGSHSELKALRSASKVKFVFGITDKALKEKLIAEYEMAQSCWVTLIHPSAEVSSTAKISEGVVILEKVVVQANCNVMAHVIVNANVMISYNTVVQEFSYLAPMAILAKGVHVGRNCSVGVNARISEGIVIGNGSTVADGAVVVSSLPNEEFPSGPSEIPSQKFDSCEMKDLCIGEDATLYDAMELIAENGFSIAMIVSDHILIGVLTDGDLRRAILARKSLDHPIKEYMSKNFIAANERISRSRALRIMKANGINHLPVIDEGGRLRDLHHLSRSFSGQTLDLAVVLMAGGRGTRLWPLTKNLPKPMVRVAGKPILEHLILHLIDHNIRKFNIAVNYLSEQIEDYFGEGGQYGCEITYLREKETRGTGGALRLLPELETKTILLMNGDLITQVDISKMLSIHKQQDNMITIGVRDYEVSIPYGVVKISGQLVEQLEEKPIQHHLINAGMYLIDAQLLAVIPEKEEYPATELVNYCIAKGFNVGYHLVEGDWADVGQHQDLARARGL